MTSPDSNSDQAIKISNSVSTDRVVLTLLGRFDFSARHAFQKAIAQAKREGRRKVIVNLTQVPFVDSAAIALLLLAQKQLSKSQITLTLVAPEGYVLQILHLMRIGDHMPIYTTEYQIV